MQKYGQLSVRWKNILIFMDYDMPIMDGLTATQEIRKMQNGGMNVLIYGVTAFTSQDIL